MAPSGAWNSKLAQARYGLVVGQAGADEVQGGPLPRVLRGRDRGPVLRHHIGERPVLPDPGSLNLLLREHGLRFSRAGPVDGIAPRMG